MSRYRFELPKQDDDEALRRVMASVSTPGSIEIAFQREPNYFRSNYVLGPDRQTIVCRDVHNNQIVGLATRSVRDMYYRGDVRRIGYLGSLRLIPSARNQSVLARGFRFIRQLHEADPNRPDFYLTTIAEGNTAAIRSLTRNRADLPRYQKLTTLHTLAISGSASGSTLDSEIEVRQPTEYGEVAAALSQIEHYRNLTPVYTAADFEVGATFDGLNAECTVMLNQDGQFNGIAGTWDQRHLRQSVVQNYSTPIRLLRPFHNLISFIRRRSPLPAIGAAIDFAYLAFPWVRDNDEGVFRSLITQSLRRLPAKVKTLLAGFCENDPLLPVARRLSHFDYKTSVYAVSWDGQFVPDRTRPYCLELGCL